MTAQARELPREQQNEARFSLNLKGRRTREKGFFVICFLGALFGIVMLAVLLWDIGADSASFVIERATAGPRMFAYLYKTDAGFKERVDRDFHDIVDGMDQKVRTKERRVKANEVTVTDAMREEWRMDYLHSQYQSDPDCFAPLNMNPTAWQRVAVAWDVTRDFLTSFPSRYFTKAGILAALVGSLYMLILTAAFAIPIGISAAVYLEEYAPKNRISRIIEVNIANLAGVPSIVYGILGLALFVRGIGWGSTVIAGSATMSLLIMPVIIIAAREAIKAVPGSIRWGAYALGATRWQVIRHHVLPIAMPGILTGVILAMSRALGESAPMIMIGALSFVAFLPKSPMDDFAVLPIQIYNWASMPQAEFQNLAAMGIAVLLIVLLLMNSVAIYLRQRLQRRTM